MKETRNNIYYFYGEEEYLIGEEIKKIKEKIFLPGSGNDDTERFSSSGNDIESIMPQLKMSSLFSPKRLVILQDYDDSDYEAVLASGKDFPDSLSIIMVSDKANNKSAFFKTLQKTATVKEFKPFAEWEETRLVSWIVTRAASLSKKMAPDVASTLIGISGSSLQKLSSELDKIATYIGERKEITERDINDLATSGDISAFAIENAYAERDLKEAISTLAVSLRSKEAPVAILAKIYSRARLFLRIKCLRERKLSRDSIIQELGMNPYYFKRCETGADSYTKEELVKALASVLKADIALKNSSQSPQVLLELLFVDLMSRGSK